MNDSTREKLSAYLDGALSDTERRAVEVEVSRSEELRLELEALRAVSAAVKGLPKEELPAGFRARLDARIAREGAAPEREYFILPPAYRPLAFALSTAVVALVVWDRTVPRQEMVSPRAGWDSETVGVKSAADAPPSIDVSGRLSTLSGAKGLEDGSKKDESSDAKAGAASTLGKNLSAPGKPLEFAESAAPAAPAPAASAFEGSRAAEPAPGAGGTFTARNEEERSAINERLYRGFEEEKKRMGIARIADKDSEADNLPLGGRDLMALQASPEAPRLDRQAIGAVRGASQARAKAKASAPVFKALSLKSAEALAAAWAAAAQPGEPPAIDFSKDMALFLAGPSGCGIVDVQQRKKFIVVLYKESGFEDGHGRVRVVAASPKPVVVKLAE